MDETQEYFLSPTELTKATIIGVAKCGTTSLWYYLSKHPEIFAHPDKELKFFYARHLTREEKEASSGGFPNSEEAKQRYVSLFEDKMKAYATEQKLHTEESNNEKKKKKKLLLEATPGYLFNCLVAERMGRVLPEAKLLVVLRDPVSRAHSEWQMRHFSQKKEQVGPVTIQVFIEEVEKDMRRIQDNIKTTTEENKPKLSLDWCGYLKECSDIDQPKGINEFQPLVGRGLYYHQLLNWAKYFPMNQIHVVSSDDMRARPAEVLNSVCRFLGIDDTFYHEEQEFLHEQKNVGGTTFKSSIGAPSSPQPAGRKEPIPAEWEEKMYAFFAPHNQLLYDWIGHDMKWARKQK